MRKVPIGLDNLQFLISSTVASWKELSEKPGKDQSEDETEEIAHDRWLFNAIVFFLLFPFMIFLTYASFSPIALGIGLALIVWRVAVTPEIVNRISFGMSSWLRRFFLNLVIAVVSGMILLGVSDYVSGDSFSGALGFPLSYTYPIGSCYGPLRAACPGIDPPKLAADYLFWVSVSLVITTFIGWTVNRWSSSKSDFIRHSFSSGSYSSRL